MTVAVLALLAILSALAAALFTAIEAAYSSLPRSEAERLTSDGARPRLERILAKPLRHARAVRFWRIWFESAAGIATALAFIKALDSVWWAGLWATLTMAAVGFVIVGASPRRYGRLHDSALVKGTAGLVRAATVALGPLPNALVRLATPKGAMEVSEDSGAFFNQERIRELVDQANQANVIEDVEADLIHSVFELGDTRVRAVMVPRTDMLTAPAGSTARSAMRLCLRSGYSRLPVIGEDADDIRGIIYLKDLVREVTFEDHPDTPVDQLARPARFVPESKHVAALLQELQREATHVAVVVDEYGGTAGLVTLEDLLEEIVGEIDDEYDPDRVEIAEVGDGIYDIPATLDLDELGDLFDESIEDDEVETAAGLLAKAIGRIPIVGSEGEIHGLHLQARTLSGRRNRLGTVRVRRAGAEGEPAASSSEAGSALAVRGSASHPPGLPDPRTHDPRPADRHHNTQG